APGGAGAAAPPPATPPPPRPGPAAPERGGRGPPPPPPQTAPAGPSTYRLPQPTGRRRSTTSRSAPARRRSTREAIRRRPRVASAIAGTATFLAAVYLGMVLFSPDSSSADTPGPGPSSVPSSQDTEGDGQQGQQGGGQVQEQQEAGEQDD
ncbi:serine/threonine protein kinase, partial [Streptomyces microflavus]